MNTSFCMPTRKGTTSSSTWMVLVSALLVSACSGSSGSNSTVSNAPDSTASESTTVNDNEVADENSIELLDQPANNSTRVTVEITVPEYVSNSLQVRLRWGDKDVLASWVVDESWVIVDDFPKNTQNRLLVTFSDDNGGITLGIFETDFKTGANSSDTLRISANQFSTEQFDMDANGISNINEPTSGNNSPTTNPTAPVPTTPLEGPQPFQASIELVPEKTFRISWNESRGATHYRVLENPDGGSGFDSVADDLTAETRSYDHRVALFKRLNARYIIEACNELSCIPTEELFVTGTFADGVGTVTTGYNDEVDSSNYLSLSGDGRTLAIGSLGEDSAASGINGDQQDNSSEDSGAVRLFRLNNGAWEEQAFIKASNPDPDDRFGRELSLSADGNTLVVGVESERSAATGISGDQQDNSIWSAGAVYVFNYTDGAWQQQAYLKASNPEQNGWFGSSVELSASGNTLAVGARGEDSEATYFEGAVYLFERTNNSWQLQSHIEPGSELIGGGRLFTSFISLSQDGNTLAVGGGPSYDEGGAFVFGRNNGVWSQQWYFDPTVIGAHPSLGRSAGALSGDGQTLVVSAINDFSPATGINSDPYASTDRIRDAGAVHVFVLADGRWTQQAYIKSSVPRRSGSFGRSVAMSSNGDTIAVLSRDDTGGLGVFDGYNFITTGSNMTSTGYLTSVSIFHRDSGIWSEGAYIKPIQSQYVFHEGMALDDSGDTLATSSRLPAWVAEEQNKPIVDSVVFVY